MNLRTVRKKIKSVKNVRKITKAMQLISAVKMKKVVQSEIEGRMYRNSLAELIASLSGRIDTSISPLLATVKDTAAKKDLIIFISANKGLCGAYHVNLLKYIVKHINYSESEFITVGSKGAQALSRFDRDIVADYSTGSPETKVSAIFAYAINSFVSGKYRSIKMLYTQYLSAIRSEVKLVTLLPISTEQNTSSQSIKQEYIVEPSPQVLVDALLRSAVEEQIRGAVISSEAVEQSMRMMAMKNATDNAGDVIYSLTLIGNKIRQTKITSELLDMVTAKESVESG